MGDCPTLMLNAPVPAAKKVLEKAGLTKDDVMGDFLHSAGLLYWNEVELYSRIARGLDGVVTSRLPSEGIFTYDLKVALLFGSPRTVSVGALLTDVDTDVQAVAALDGDPETPIDYLALTKIGRAHV